MTCAEEDACHNPLTQQNCRNLYRAMQASAARHQLGFAGCWAWRNLIAASKNQIIVRCKPRAAHSVLGPSLPPTRV